MNDHNASAGRWVLPILLLLLFLPSMTRAEGAPLYLAVDGTLTTETVTMLPSGYRAVGLDQFQRLTRSNGLQPDLSQTVNLSSGGDTYVPVGWLSRLAGYRVEWMQDYGCIRILTTVDSPDTEAFLSTNAWQLNALRAADAIARRQVRLELAGVNSTLLEDDFAIQVNGRSYVPLEKATAALGLKAPLKLQADGSPIVSRQFLVWRTAPVIEMDGTRYIESGYLADFSNARLTMVDAPEAVHLLASDVLASPHDVFAPGPALDKASENLRRQSSKLFKTAWLTFDDGPSAKVTPQVLDVLDEYGVKATFFILGKEAARRPETLRRIVDSGHVVGNHSWTHEVKNLYRTPEGFFEEIEKTKAFLEEFTHEEVLLVRAPYGPWGNFKAGHYSGMTDRGLRLVNWNVDSGDSKSLSVKAPEIVEEVRRFAERNTEMVILMHDSATKAETAKALPEIIEMLREKGFDILPLDIDTEVHVKGVVR